jgi:hypothetical protein
MLRRLLKTGPAMTALALCLTTGLAQAQEFITARSALSDEDFYRLVSCAAPPSGDCQKPVVRWSRRDAKDVSVRIVQIADGYPTRLAAMIENGLDGTIAELNAAGANLRVSRAKASKTPDIGIHLLPIREGGIISGTGLVPLDGIQIDIARAQVWWRDNRTLINCAIVFSKDIKPQEVASLLLEEVTQCMGLLTDIGGGYYMRRSIFSETSNELTKLGSQDIMALRRHYP